MTFPLHKAVTALLLAFAMGALLSCDDDMPREPMTIGRTVLVYMASNSNLSSYSAEDYKGILRGYLPQWFDSGSGDVLLVYLHLRSGAPSLIRLSSRDGVACEDTLIRYPQQNSCMDTTFRRVLKDAFGTYSSSERGLILSSHGTGWLPEGYYDDPVEYWDALSQSVPTASGKKNDAGDGLVHYELPEDPYAWMVKSFGYDEDGWNEMEIYDLRDAIDFKLDYLLFDCCLMGGAEVAYEMKDRAGYIIFSQTEILADGFPYDSMMEEAFRKGADVGTRCCAMAKLYYDYYDSRTSDYRSATISVIKSSEMESLASAVADVMAAGGRDNTDTLSLTGSKVRTVQRYFRYNRHWFYDLDDYIAHVCPSDALYGTFAEALDRAVVYKAATPSFMESQGGFAITHYSGLSTYIDNPKNRYLENHYAKLDWGKVTLP